MRRKIKRTVFGGFLIAVISLIFTVEISAESFFEYYFIPGETENADTEAGDSYENFIAELPDDIKSQLPEKMFSEDIGDIADGATEITDFSYVWKKIVIAITDSLFPSLKLVASVFGILILSSVLRAVRESFSSQSTGELVGTVINAGIAITLVGMELNAVKMVESFREVICGLMNGMVPLLGAVYAASGNVGTGAVQSGGIVLLVTLCQNLFAYILLPSIKICLVLSIAGAVFPDIGIKSVSASFRNIATTVLVSAVTLFSFMLGLQNNVAQSADSFGARSIKFAVGNLIPIIGGAVSDSLGTIGGSLSVLKSAGGSAAIVIIIILVLPTIATLIIHRLALFICKSTAGILGCTSEESLLGDMGAITSMMLAFTAAISVAFIYALTLFTGSTLAMTS